MSLPSLSSLSRLCAAPGALLAPGLALSSAAHADGPRSYATWAQVMKGVERQEPELAVEWVSPARMKQRHTS